MWKHVDSRNIIGNSFSVSCECEKCGFIESPLFIYFFYFLSAKTKKAFTMYSLNPAWKITNNIVTSYKFEMSFFEIFLHYIIYCGYLYSLLRSFVYPNIISKEQFYVETKVVRRSSK